MYERCYTSRWLRVTECDPHVSTPGEKGRVNKGAWTSTTDVTTTTMTRLQALPTETQRPDTRYASFAVL